MMGTNTIGPISYLLAWWVGYTAMLIGFYIIFICERHDIPVIGYGIFVSIFGFCVYSVVRFPAWLPGFIGRDFLLSFTLFLISIAVVFFTRLIWRCYQLKPPWVRFGEILTLCGNWLQK